jgi:hypothetical protein
MTALCAVHGGVLVANVPLQSNRFIGVAPTEKKKSIEERRYESGTERIEISKNVKEL